MSKQVHEIVYTLWLNDMEFTCCSRWAYSDPAEFAQFMSDNIGEVLTDNVAQKK